MFLGSLKIGARLGVAFSAVLIMVLGIVVLAVSRLDVQDALLSHFTNERVPQVVTSHKWAISVLESARHTRNIFVLDHDKIPEELGGLEDQKKLRSEYVNAAEREVDTQRGKELLKNTADANAIYVPDEDEFIRLVQANRLDEAKKLLIDKARPEQLAYLDKIYAFIDYQVALIGTERNEVRDRYIRGRSMIVGIGVAAILASAVFAFWITRSITLPLQHAVRTAERVAGGDLSTQIEVGGRDETGQLLSALRNMMHSLAKIAGDVQNSGIQVNSSVTAIAATGKEQQATASEIAATTTEIGATSKEISATSRELVKTMNEVSAVAEQSATLANSGQAGLSRMEDTMRQVMEAATSINAKLAVLNEKAGNINQVVTTITKVADQTNLLSLNAAIEAEKAGEYGRGFAVVASEIRRLADQTAVATYDIEQTVKEIQSAVSAGVMGMDKFSEEVRRGMQEVQHVGGELSQIIQQVQALAPRVESVNEGMQAQATGAEQISQALTQLSEAAQQTVESLRHSAVAVDGLMEVSVGLHASVSRFKL
ncbi:MAG TPA: methyl-accepting chemotaxis protein [Steroidobacteraceae bacterium]|nr:methyl-accepting chemotaxis protein [Steroidobacteraceae bacterium]